MSFIASVRDFARELRRRRVTRVAVAYGVVAWLMVEVSAAAEEALALPTWTDSFVVLIALVGFPLAMILAWAYDLSPEGVKRTGSDAENPPALRANTPPAAAIARQLPRRAPPRREAARPAAAPSSPPPADLQPTPEDLRRALLATLRHELRTPLNAVIGYSELLLEDLPPEREAPVRAILTAGQRSLLLVNEILRPDAGETELTDDVLAAMRRRIREEMDESTARLGELCAEARTALQDADADTLADVDRIAEAAGRLRTLVLSELNGPAVGIDQSAAGLTRELAARVIAGLPRGGAVEENAPPLHGHILVVDDNPTNRDLLSRQLARQGFSVALAEDGNTALELLRRQDFDLVLLDVLMPGLDGIGVLTQMQRDRATTEVPVIMTSAMDEIEGVVRCIEQGAVDYLIKPFDPVLLQARLSATLDLYRMRAQQRRARQELEEESAWAERLARSLVPDRFTPRLRAGRGALVESQDSLAVVIVVLQGLSTYATRQGDTALAEWLLGTMEAFEACAQDLPVELRWEGGAALVATSAPADPADEPDAVAIGELALRLREEGVARAADVEAIRVGIGIHVGPAVASLIETDRFAFGLWGEAPEVARELAAQGETGTVHVSPAAYAALHGAFEFETRGIIETSSGTQMPVYALLERREADRVS